MSFAAVRHVPRQRRELPAPMNAPERAGGAVGGGAAPRVNAKKVGREKGAEKAMKPGVGARRRLPAEAARGNNGGSARTGAAQRQHGKKRGQQDVEDEKAKYLAELSTSNAQWRGWRWGCMPRDNSARACPHLMPSAVPACDAVDLPARSFVSSSCPRA